MSLHSNRFMKIRLESNESRAKYLSRFKAAAAQFYKTTFLNVVTRINFVIVQEWYLIRL